LGENSPNLVTLIQANPPFLSLPRFIGFRQSFRSFRGSIATGVTRLGEFSPIGRLFSLGSFLKLLK
jgi:hypothetical protein